MRRWLHTLTGLPLLALGCVAMEIGEGEDPGLVEIDLQADNGIFLDNGLELPNGLKLPNGVALHNGLDLANGLDLPNGIDLANGIELPNGITGLAYAPPAGSGLEQWIDVDPAMRVRILRYLVECALPAGVEVDILYRGNLAPLGAGALGLGPGLREGEMAEEEQEAVSACLLARINGWGDRIQIDLFGGYPGLDQSTASDAAFRRFEATYFGNVFAPDPVAYVCTQNRRGCEQMRGCRAGSDGTCECGIFETAGLTPGDVHCGTGFTNDYGIQGYQCTRSETLETSQYYLNDCVDEWSRTWRAPITVWFKPAGNGETCRYDDMCDSWACNRGTCAARATSGATCDSPIDCQSYSCIDGFCGSKAGSYCTSGLQCRSGVCSKKHVCL